MKMDDLISREEALKVCDKYNGQGYVWSCIRGDIEKLPPAQPQNTRENTCEITRLSNDSISRQAAIDAFKSIPTINGLGLQPLITVDDVVKILNGLPSAQPEPSQVARDIATIIENEQDMRVMLSQRWIPVSERLPEELTTVLITDKDGDVFVAGFIEVIDGCAEWTTDGVIAWMPLPEPYKERREE